MSGLTDSRIVELADMMFPHTVDRQRALKFARVVLELAAQESTNRTKESGGAYKDGSGWVGGVAQGET